MVTVWKGAALPELAVIDDFGNCSYSFTRGGRYLIFGRRHPTVPGALETTICTATRPIRPEDVAALPPVRATQVQLPATEMRETRLHRIGRVGKGSARFSSGI